MTEQTTMDMVELAFAVRLGERLLPDQVKQLDLIRSDLRDSDLFDGILGLLDDIQSCVSCTEEAGDMHEPVDEELLAAFLDGSLDRRGRDRTIALLARSRAAREVFTDLARTLKDIGFNESKSVSAYEYLIGVGQGILRFLATPTEGFMSLQAQPAAVLGPNAHAAEKDCRWVQSAGDVRVTFHVTPARTATVNLHVCIGNEERAGSDNQLTLYQEEQMLESVTVQEGENFVFRNMPIGQYRVEVTPLQRESVSFLLQFEALS